MVAVPTHSNALDARAFALPSHDGSLQEQTFGINPLLRFLFNGEIADQSLWQEKNGSMKGYSPNKITYGSQRYIERSLIRTTLSETGVLALATAGSNAVTTTKVTPWETLTGSWGVVYGTMIKDLEMETYGKPGGENFRPIDRSMFDQMAQEICTTLTAGFYSDGTTNKFDGFDMWAAVTGTKWDSSNIATTDTFLQGQAKSSTKATLTKTDVRDAIRQTKLGGIAGVYAQGPKPNFCVMDNDTFDQMKVWFDDKQTIEITTGEGVKFKELGMPDDYFFFDGVCFFPDAYLDSNLGGNQGLAYMGNSNLFEVIIHEDWGFDDIDPLKHMEAAKKLDWVRLPSLLWTYYAFRIVLMNMFCKRPRNFLKWALT